MRKINMRFNPRSQLPLQLSYIRMSSTNPILVSVVMEAKWMAKYVPAHIRHLLAAKRSCSDGVAPFLFFSPFIL